MRIAAALLGLLGIVACSPAPEPRDEVSSRRLAVEIRPETPEDPGSAPGEAGPAYLATVRVLGLSSDGADRVELTKTAFVFHAGEEHSLAIGGLKPGVGRAEEDTSRAFPPPGWQGALFHLNAGEMAASGAVLVHAEIWEAGALVWQDDVTVRVNEP